MPVIVGAPTGTTPGTGPRLVATADDGLHPPGVLLQVGGVTPNGRVTITRTDPDGRTRAVREAEPLDIDASGNGACYDHEAPHNSVVRYQIAALKLTSETVQVSSDQVWLVDPGNPASAANFPLRRLLEVQDRSYAPRGILTDVPGREESVVTVMGSDVTSPESGVVVRTTTTREGNRLRDLLRTTSVLLLQVPAFAGQRQLYEYVYCTGRSETPVARATVPDIRWSLPYRVVARPAGRQRAVRSLDALGDEFETLDDIGLVFGSLDDIGANIRAVFAP